MSEEDDFVRITLRIPKIVHEQLTTAAAGKKSMNAEIIDRLEKFQDARTVLEHFELAKERILAQTKMEAELRRQIDVLTRALDVEKSTSAQKEEAYDELYRREAALNSQVLELQNQLEKSEARNQRLMDILESRLPEKQ